MHPDFRTGEARKDERGVAIAELAIAVPILLALLLVIFDFGRGFHAYISIVNGARDGARVSMQDISDANIRNAAIKGAGSYGTEAAFSVNAGTCGVPAAGFRRVTVTYTYSSVLPFIGEFWDGVMSESLVTQAKCS